VWIFKGEVIGSREDTEQQTNVQSFG
jgi:hypothetical protein